MSPERFVKGESERTISCLSLVYAMFDVSLVSSICVPKWTN